MYNNLNSNNFMLGVIPETKKTNSTQLINHLKNIENSSNKKISKNNLPKMQEVVDELITKLENDVYTLTNQIKNFNKEKKNITELHQKEVIELKNIIVNLYILVITINKSIDLKKNNKVNLLEKLRKAMEKNPGLLKVVDNIAKDKTIELYEESQTENNLKISNILKNGIKTNENTSTLNNLYLNVIKNTDINKLKKNSQSQINSSLNNQSQKTSSLNSQLNEINLLNNNNENKINNPLNSQLNEINLLNNNNENKINNPLNSNFQTTSQSNRNSLLNSQSQTTSQLNKNSLLNNLLNSQSQTTSQLNRNNSLNSQSQTTSQSNRNNSLNSQSQTTSQSNRNNSLNNSLNSHEKSKSSLNIRQSIQQKSITQNNSNNLLKKYL